MCVLELTSVRMYEFHYHYIKQKYDSKWRLLVADTDSLMHEIETYNVYDNFSKNKRMFGFSNHSSDSKYYNDPNA